jgi:hypothetical protein
MGSVADLCKFCNQEMTTRNDSVECPTRNDVSRFRPGRSDQISVADLPARAQWTIASRLPEFL